MDNVTFYQLTKSGLAHKVTVKRAKIGRTMREIELKGIAFIKSLRMNKGIT